MGIPNEGDPYIIEEYYGRVERRNERGWGRIVDSIRVEPMKVDCLDREMEGGMVRLKDAILDLVEINMGSMYNEIEWENEGGTIGFDRDAKEKELFDQDSVMMICFDVNRVKLLGVAIVVSYMCERGEVFIVEFQVHPARQGQGIGSALMNRIIDICRAPPPHARVLPKRIKMISLCVQSNNPKALDWYKSKWNFAIQMKSSKYFLLRREMRAFN